MTPQVGVAPALSVVIVSTAPPGSLRKVIRHLSAQTIVDRLEVVLVAPSELGPGLDRSDMELFGRFQIVSVGPIRSVGQALAEGIRRAEAPVVALLEDHAYPCPTWAAVVVEAHRGPWSAVATPINNENPESLLSRTNFLISYGRWADPVVGGEVEDLPAHNVAYKRELLHRYDGRLEELRDRGGYFHEELRAAGCRFHLTTQGPISHLNPSRLVPILKLRFMSGRMYGATRVLRERWSPRRRLLYLGGLPLIPVMRFRRLMSEVRGSDGRRTLPLSLVPLLLTAIVVESVGEAAGYAAGLGDAPRRITEIEMQRLYP
ncbi:MAG TPA: hypothetical protein VM737_12005 [Gemmatimonadota bacterium]|nr:hypothetical protein [Gemmatimonadota bacterium]